MNMWQNNVEYHKKNLRSEQLENKMVCLMKNKTMWNIIRKIHKVNGRITIDLSDQKEKVAVELIESLVENRGRISNEIDKKN